MNKELNNLSCSELSDKNNSRDLILLLNGGGMLGIFSSGFLDTLREKGLLDRVHSIYATSAGACNSLFFLANSSNYDFYTNSQIQKSFMNFNFIVFIKYVYQLIRFKLNPKYQVQDLVDLNSLLQIIQYSKFKLNLDLVDLENINFYVKVFNISKFKHEFLKVTKDNLLSAISASCNAVPLTHKLVRIGNEGFVDGDSLRNDLEDSIIKKYSKIPKKIIQIHSFPTPKLSIIHFFKSLPRLILASSLIWLLFGFKIYRKYIYLFYKYFSYGNLNSKNMIKVENNIINVQNEFDDFMFCKDINKLDKLYKNGIKHADLCIEKLNKLNKLKN